MLEFSGILTMKENSDETIAVYGNPYPLDTERGRRGSIGQGSQSQNGISDATYYNWKSKYGGMSANELKRLREVEEENAKLKRMYADLALEFTIKNFRFGLPFRKTSC